MFQKLTNTPTQQYNDFPAHYYVDDSTSTISSKTVTLLQSYYKINFLKINPDKTKFIKTCKPCHSQSTKDIFIQAGTFIITQSDKLKILGIYITNGLDHI